MYKETIKMNIKTLKVVYLNDLKEYKEVKFLRSLKEA